MRILIDIFGDSADLNTLQTSARAVVVFFFTLLLVRIAGRRSFGLRAPLDNIILILLGAMIGRAVVGASPFVPTLVASFVICILHRLFAYVSLFSPVIDRVLKGKKIALYKNGKVIKHNLNRSLMSQEDLKEEVRLRGHVESLDDLESLYMERNGEVSVVRKN